LFVDRIAAEIKRFLRFSRNTFFPALFIPEQLAHGGLTRGRTLPPDQFEVRPVRTKRGITMVGLFSAAITRAEREADAPYREAMAAKRLARVTRAERRMARSMARRKVA
jgi:hypothetical protein